MSGTFLRLVAGRVRGTGPWWVLWWVPCSGGTGLLVIRVGPPHRCIYNRSGEWMDETLPILLSTTVAFSYVTFLMVTGPLQV